MALRSIQPGTSSSTTTTRSNSEVQSVTAGTIAGRLGATSAFTGFLAAACLASSVQAADELSSQEQSAPVVQESGAEEPPTLESPAETAARAQVAVVDLADSLRAVGDQLTSAAPISNAAGVLTAGENAQQVESATKVRLSQMTDELDQLSAALASGASPEITRTLVDSLIAQAAALSRLGQRTDRPLFTADQAASLSKQWQDVRALSVKGAAEAAQAAVLGAP